MIWRLSALRPWGGPVGLSVALHAAAFGAAVGLRGPVEPPRPMAVIPVTLVFEPAPAPAITGPARKAAVRTSTSSARTALPTITPHPVRPSTGSARTAIANTKPSPPLPGRKPPPPDPPAARVATAQKSAPPPALAAVPRPAAAPPVRVPPGWGAPGLGNRPPVYPPAARRRGIEGRVVLRVEVGADGRARSVAVARGSGHHLLDAAARQAVAGWRFVPARLAGLPVAAAVDVPVVFRLTD